jgi:signal peptide peptidase SppA
VAFVPCSTEAIALLRTALTLDTLAEVPWALERAVLAQLISAAQRGEAITAATRQPMPARNAGAVAVIPIHGVIEHRSSFLLELFGGTSIEEIRGMLRAAVADQQVRSIVLDIDSPGGGVGGVTELAAEIRAARGIKRIVAVANTTAASAAYWLASQADHILVTPSGQVGSIGIYAVHLDISRALDQEGVTPTIISAGERKTEGNEFEPLSDEARAEMQRRADAFYAQFVGDVAKGRKVSAAKVEADYGQGAVMLAQTALAAGLVDGIGTLDEALRLASRPPAQARAEDEERDPAEVELPFHSRLDRAVEELAALVDHATIRAALRAKEGRRAFSESQFTALRSIHESFSALLTADDPPPEPLAADDPPAPIVPVAPAPPKRFRSQADWTRYVQEITN